MVRAKVYDSNSLTSFIDQRSAEVTWFNRSAQLKKTGIIVCSEQVIDVTSGVGRSCTLISFICKPDGENTLADIG